MDFFGLPLSAVDPSQTRTLDLFAAAGASMLRRAESIRDSVPQDDAATLAEANKEVEAVRAQIAGYVPGSGPLFLVGHMPGRKGAEVDGLGRIVLSHDDLVKRSVADFDWSRLIVRYSVRGHSRFTFSDGREVPFTTETLTESDETVSVVSRETLRVYEASKILGRLAVHSIETQRLSESEKKA